MTDKKRSPVKRVRRKMKLSDYIRKHSPIKNGVRLPDEDEPLAKYNKILDRIYLGNFEAAEDQEFFKTKRIKAVLNCTRDIPHHFNKDDNIEYMRIPVEDSLKEKDYELMYEYLPCAVEFIHKHAKIANKNILVHCHAGRQRSAISVAAYLVAKYNLSPHDACHIVLSKRPEAFHHGLSLNFEDSLNKYYKMLKKCRK
jgi:protein-tyrosine phosphatase